MKIDDLKYGEIKEILKVLNVSNGVRSKNIYDGFVGKYVICRTYNEGVNAGVVRELDETGVVLEDARRLHFHKPCKVDSWYEGVSKVGLSNDSRASIARTKLILEDYSLTECSEEAEKSIRRFKAHEQS